MAADRPVSTRTAVLRWLGDVDMPVTAPLAAIAVEVAGRLDRTKAVRDTAALSSELRKVLAEIRDELDRTNDDYDELERMLSTPMPAFYTDGKWV